MAKSYRHLGPYSDLVTAAQHSQPLFPNAPPGLRTQRLVHQTLAFSPSPEKAKSVKVEAHWEKDGVAGKAISWSVGYGPRTQAWLLRPSGVSDVLPGVVALFDHSLFKFYGKEKIAEGPEPAREVLRAHWRHYYGGRAFANALAKEGFAVLVHDAFLWGSRKFPLDVMPEFERQQGHEIQDLCCPPNTPEEIATYNAASLLHEHTVAKYATVLGSTLAGIISHEDRVAVSYLAACKNVDTNQIGCIGLSGGGLRAGLLQATDKRIKAAVVVGLMTTYEAILDHNLAGHTWMFYPSGWSRYGDWPDLVGCRAPSPLLVQYNTDDDLFTTAGQRAAHRRLTACYKSVNATSNYSGQFYPGAHKFDLTMQQAAFSWLRRQLAQ